MITMPQGSRAHQEQRNTHMSQQQQNFQQFYNKIDSAAFNLKRQTVYETQNKEGKSASTGFTSHIQQQQQQNSCSNGKLSLIQECCSQQEDILGSSCLFEDQNQFAAAGRRIADVGLAS